MIKSAIARTPILVFILMFFSLGYTIAHNKVVVVPLGSTEPTLDIYYGAITSLGVLEAGDFDSASRTNTGDYIIDVDGRPLSGCSAVASSGWLIVTDGSGSVRSDATLSASVGSPASDDEVLVKIRRFNAGTGTVQDIDTDFHLMVMCPRA